MPTVSILRHMQLLVNDKQFSVDVPADESLLSVLRNDLDLTGSKYGCGEGACGACTVLINGLAVRSCITKIGSVLGKSITTIEGLASGEKLHQVQQSFLEVDAFQCAYCASGMIMSAVSLLKKNNSPSDEQIVHAMEGNICRCGGYSNILKAIKNASASNSAVSKDKTE
ncbi:MAG TPA: (2Fe-2S)-binding protein [Chryseolinea sp.]|nr:(2Fe-2S)-binding protein [Chryseolinea sp.]